MKILAIILIVGFVGFIVDLLATGPQSRSEREDNMRNGRVQK